MVMKTSESKKLAIIPARSGSKRIPGKNIRNFAGKPVMAYSIEAARETGLFDEIMVSTDSEEIAGVAVKYGARVPFLRSEPNSNDHAVLADVAREVLEQYALASREFDVFCFLLPTAPLIRPEKIKEAFDLLVKMNYTSVFPVVRYNYPIQRSLKIEKGRLIMTWPEFEKTRSQDLPDSYHDAGQFYLLNSKAFLLEGKFFSANSGAIILEESEVQDIDTEDDWLIAELKYKHLHSR